MITKGRNKFNFFVPLEIEKSKGDDGQELVKIKGIASSNSEDSDEEVLEPSGFDYSALLKSGFLNWNHQGLKTSKAICGEPTKAKVINNGKDFYIEGFLYPNEEGKNVANLAETLQKHSPGRRLGFSIEGVPVAVDPFNKKRITKARITGVAITQCPKNPNTLLSIMKGEYSEAFQEPLEEEEEGKEKAMTTESIAPATPEHVEGGDKIKDQVKEEGAKKVGRYLKKSEIYGIILNRYDVDSQGAQRIYSFVEQLNTNIFNMKKPEITSETLNKAFEILELAKSKKEEGEALSTEGKEKETNISAEVGPEETDALKDSEKTIQKSKDAETEEKDEEKEEKIQKAKTVAYAFMKSGMTKEDTVSNMEKAGYEVEISGAAYDSCVADANNNTDGGKITGMTVMDSGIVKSYLSEMLTGVGNQITAFQKASDEKLNVLGLILKSTKEENAILKSQLEGAVTTINGLNEKMETLGAQRGSRKSLQQAREKFDTGEQQNTIQKANESVPLGCEAFNIQNKEDLRRLAQSLSSKVQIMKSQSGDTQLVRRLENTITEIEVGYFVDPDMYPTLRNLNIILQKPDANQ